MKIRCPECGKTHNAPDAYKGRKVKCLNCDTEMVATPVVETKAKVVAKKKDKPVVRRISQTTQPVEIARPIMLGINIGFGFWIGTVMLALFVAVVLFFLALFGMTLSG